MRSSTLVTAGGTDANEQQSVTRGRDAEKDRISAVYRAGHSIAGDRLREKRTLSEKETWDLVPDDLWRKPGSRVRKELHDEMEQIGSDGAYRVGAESRGGRSAGDR